MKTCKRCGRQKPYEQFYKMPMRKDGATPQGDGFRTVCRACTWEDEKERRSRWPAAKRKAYKEKQQQCARRWDADNPYAAKAAKANYRARKAGSKCRLSGQDVRIAWEKWEGRCWICGCVADELDHFRPTNKRAGGTNTPDNIRPVCADCNYKRSHQWHGIETAGKEAALLRQLKELLSKERT